jgi:hypothetical protein
MRFFNLQFSSSKKEPTWYDKKKLYTSIDEFENENRKYSKSLFFGSLIRAQTRINKFSRKCPFKRDGEGCREFSPSVLKFVRGITEEYLMALFKGISKAAEMVRKETADHW